MRVAHCSDLHLLSLEGAKLLDFANKRWIGGLNLLTNRGRQYHTHVFEAMVEDLNAAGVDHVICTGDITNLALEQEFHFARAFFDRLALGARDVTVLPGNHDTYVAQGLELFRTIFTDYHRADEDWLGVHTWPMVRVRGSLAIIGLSTSKQTPWFTAYGRVGADQLERLATALTDPRLQGKLRLVALHHPPTGKAARNPVRGLRDWDKFAEVIAGAGAELIIHGHEHRDLRDVLPGPDDRSIDVLGVQSGTYHAHRPERTARYRIFEFADEGGRPSVMRHWLRRWDAQSEGFVDDEALESALAEVRESA